MANKLLPNDGMCGELPDYGSFRNRNIEIVDDDDNICSRNKWTWTRGGIVLLITLIITAIFLGIFLKNNNPPTKPSIFGGMYSIATNPNYNVINHHTKDLNCPNGYTSYTIGHFLACYRCGGVHLNLCLKNNINSDPQQFFGGMYNINECGDNQYKNPLTQNLGCDTDNGYIPYLAIASQTDGFCDTNIFVCLRGELDYYNLGGFYTEYTTSNGCVTCSEGNVNNAMINSLQCPDKYDKHLLAYTYSAGGLSGCPGCDGMAYICEMPQL